MKKLSFSFAFLGIVFLITSCGFIGNKRVVGDGHWKSEEKSVGPFKSIQVSGAADVHITQGETKNVRVEIDQNLQEYVDVHVSGETLIIRTRDGINLDPSKEMTVFVTNPSFESVRVSGAGSIISESKINNPGPIDMEVSGAGDIKVEVNAPKVGVGISGAGSAVLVGETKDFELEISGAGKAKCYDLRSESTSVSISGAGHAEVFASMHLDATTSGAGSVKYRGKPADVKSSKSGAGSIEPAE